MREEKSFSQRAFSIYTDIRKLQDKAKTSYTLRTRRIRSEKRNQKQYKKSRDEVQGEFVRVGVKKNNNREQNFEKQISYKNT